MIVLEILSFLIGTTCAFLLGNIVMLPIPVWSLIFLIPLFLLFLVLPSFPGSLARIHSGKLKNTKCGTALLKIFHASMVLDLIFNIPAM